MRQVVGTLHNRGTAWSVDEPLRGPVGGGHGLHPPRTTWTYCATFTSMGMNCPAIAQAGGRGRRDPRCTPVMTAFLAGQHRLLEGNSLAPPPGAGPARRIDVNHGQYHTQVLAGDPADSPALARQVEHILQLLHKLPERQSHDSQPAPLPTRPPAFGHGRTMPAGGRGAGTRSCSPSKALKAIQAATVLLVDDLVSDVAPRHRIHASPTRPHRLRGQARWLQKHAPGLHRKLMLMAVNEGRERGARSRGRPVHLWPWRRRGGTPARSRRARDGDQWHYRRPGGPDIAGRTAHHRESVPWRGVLSPAIPNPATPAPTGDPGPHRQDAKLTW